MKGYLIDTNIFLRILTNDDPAQAEKSKAFILQVISGEKHAYTTVAVLLELAWTLESYFGLKPEEVAEKLSLITATPKLQIENRRVVEEAIEIYKEKHIDFADCYNAAFAKIMSGSLVLSYDRDFDKVSGLKRKTP